MPTIRKIKYYQQLKIVPDPDGAGPILKNWREQEKPIKKTIVCSRRNKYTAF